jgi:LacI family transcriptional regulator
VPLTSVRQPAAEMGRLATQLLLAEAEALGADEGGHRHESVVLQPELVVRGSSLHRLG